jgi:hypothetical protein
MSALTLSKSHPKGGFSPFYGLSAVEELPSCEAGKAEAGPLGPAFLISKPKYAIGSESANPEVIAFAQAFAK